MDISTGNLDALITDIVGRVMNTMQRGVQEDETARGTLAVFTTCVPSAKNAVHALVENYGDDVECALFGEAKLEPCGFSSVKVSDGIAENELMKKAETKERIVLVTPKISLLEKIAEGRDDGFVEHVFLRSLLWGRKTCILLDFVKPKFKRGTFFEKTTNILESLTSMGVEIANYACPVEKIVNAYSLVTENDVIDAGRRKETSILLAKGAIVTQLAAETARDLNIKLE
jgi:hypothetical protein